MRTSIDELTRVDWPSNVAGVLNGKIRKGLLESQAGAEGNPQEIKDAAVFVFLKHLRNLVDQWISSGKNVDHIEAEDPWRRCVYWSSTAHPKPIVDALSRYTNVCAPELLFGPNSQIEIGMLPKSRQLRPLDVAWSRAVWWFVMLLDSPGRERLFSCDSCGKYFVRVRAPKKETLIYHGTYCKSCKDKGKDRARRTVESRNRRTEEKIRWAADAWSKWKQDRRHGKRSEWVAEQVNKNLLLRGESIKGNWVTRNQNEIEAEVERRNYATGKN